MNQRSRSLNDAFVEGRIRLSRFEPARLPLLVGMPKLARVEQTNTFKICLHKIENVKLRIEKENRVHLELKMNN